MLGSIFLAMSLDFATLTSVKKVRNLQHANLPIQDINFPTKNSKSPDLGSRMYHMYGAFKLSRINFHLKTEIFQKVCCRTDLKSISLNQVIGMDVVMMLSLSTTF